MNSSSIQLAKRVQDHLATLPFAGNVKCEPVPSPSLPNDGASVTSGATNNNSGVDKLVQPGSDVMVATWRSVSPILPSGFPCYGLGICISVGLTRSVDSAYGSSYTVAHHLACCQEGLVPNALLNGW